VSDIVEHLRIYPLFPNALEAPEILYKKLWVQLNRMTNQIVVSVGDMYNAHSQSLLTYDFDNDYPNNAMNTWENEEHSFPMPLSGSSLHPPSQDKPLNILSVVKKLAIYVIYPPVESKEVGSQQVSDYMTIKFMKNIKSYSPVLEPNPSVLDSSTAPLADMSQ